MITVVSIDALSYSGTTWLNLLLGSHEKAFTLGPPDRVWELQDKGFVGANLVHGIKDTFWKSFNHYWDRKENFLVALANYANVSHIIFDNPSEKFKNTVMLDKKIVVKKMQYIRDGRAITASYKRLHPDKKYIDTLLPSGWFYHAFKAWKISHQQFYRHEDCLQDPFNFLKSAGEYVGLNYSKDAIRFWEWDHHITSGNPGPIVFIKLAKGYKIESHEFYKKQFEKACRNPLNCYKADRWKKELSREELFQFDFMLGKNNEGLGYKRDVFSFCESCYYKVKNLKYYIFS